MAKNPKLSVVGSKATAQQPPRKLGEHGRKLWHDVTTEYDITDVGGIELLAQACAAADRAEMLSELIEEQGATIKGRHGIRAHPCLKDELNARNFVVRTLSRLGITTEAIKPMGRPPSGFGVTDAN